FRTVMISLNYLFFSLNYENYSIKANSIRCNESSSSNSSNIHPKNEQITFPSVGETSKSTKQKDIQIQQSNITSPLERDSPLRDTSKELMQAGNVDKAIEVINTIPDFLRGDVLSDISKKLM